MRVLMCPPTHFRIAYEINAWMDRRRQPDSRLAQLQWDRLVVTLRSLGARIELIQPNPRQPDMVFTANAGLIRGQRFIPSNFRYQERRGERRYFVRYFHQRGYQVTPISPGSSFEGEGDVLPYRDLLFAGFRQRSDIRSHQGLGQLLPQRVISLELVDPKFYHLDTCFLPLDSRSVLFYPGAFDRYGQRAIREFVANPIPVTREEALRFVCNGVVLRKTILMNQPSRRLIQLLKQLSYRVQDTPTSEFLKAGGSCKCLVLTLSKPPSSI
ncbi:MAG: amidinotransferase [Elusimicrobia bacterium]|nr:amidinotransferase [Elusimicrobiota bacterium]